MDPVEQMLKFLGEIVLYGGGSVGIAYLAFRFLGKKWIESIFAKSLEEYKHKLNKELEQHKYQVNSLFSRVTKIHEKEFEVLPEAWFKMQDALGRISGLVSIIKEWPDLDRMGDTALEGFISKSKLHEHERKELLSSTKKLDYYQKTIFWHELHETQKAFWDFHNYINHNQIFLSADLQEQFMKLDDIMWSTIVERKVGQEPGGQEMCISAYKQIRDDVSPIRDKIASLVQSRLHYQDVD